MPPPPCCSQISIISAISESQMFQWNVLSYIQISKTFEWNVGEGPLYWYLVEVFHEGRCPSVDSTCATEYHTVAATSAHHLCERLREMQLGKKIKSVKKWTKPALNCDVQNDIRNGIDHSCNELEEVDFCIEECNALIPSNICPNLDYTSLTWYTQYLHLSTPVVSQGQTVIQGQRIGELAGGDDYPTIATPHLHFGVGDGVGGVIGQTIDLTDFFSLPAQGERAAVSGPGSNIFSPEDITFIKEHLISPVDRNSCDWWEVFGSTSHTGAEYYAMDWFCHSGGVPKSTQYQEVYVACGGSDVTSTVYQVADLGGNGWGVIVRHEKIVPGSSAEYEFSLMPNLSGPGFKGIYSEKGFGSSEIEIQQPRPKVIDMKEVLINEVMPLEHNFHKSRLFGSFLDRSGLKIDEVLYMQYNESSNSWQFREAFNREEESWTLMAELARESSKAWTFHVSFSRTIKGITKHSRFKFRFGFPPIDKFFLEGSFYIKAKTLELPLPYSLESNSILDEIGIFEGQWNADFMRIILGEDK